MNISDAESIDNIFTIVKIDKSEKTVVGEVLIRDEAGELYDKFHVRLVFNSKLKYNFPKVSEIGHSIPWIADRHVYNDGTFCLAIPHEELNFCKNGLTFREFIQNILYKYLVNQSLINNGVENSFLMGEHAHNEQGLLNHYLDIFPGLTPTQLVEVIRFALNHIASKNSKHLCPCGSNENLVYCHFIELGKVKSYGKKRLSIDLLKLSKSSI